VSLDRSFMKQFGRKATQMLHGGADNIRGAGSGLATSLILTARN